MELTGKIALVTGASRRVGRAIALELAGRGAHIALHYNRSLDAAQQTAREIAATGRRVELFPANLADAAQIDQMFQGIGRSFGRLDVLVNNASVYDPTPLETLTAEQWDAQMAVNARAPALCIRHALPLMTGGGVIINIADVSAERPRADWSAYCSSKAALLALTRSAAKALATRNIRVNSVAPGIAAWPEDASEARKARLLQQVPMRRAGSPQDVAAAVAFLIDNDYITGQNMRIDGGWNMM